MVSFEAGEGEKTAEEVGSAFVAQGQAAVAGQPDRAAFDCPSVTAESVVAESFAGGAWVSSSLPQPGP